MVVGDQSLEVETVVVGSGPGGYVAAIRAAQLGQEVVIVERDQIGGVCLNVGCIPSKALINAGHSYQNALKEGQVFGVNAENVTLDFARTQEWKDNDVVKRLTSGVEMLLKKNKVKIERGEAVLVNENRLRVIYSDVDHQTYDFKNCIIATGGRPIEIPGFEFNDRVVDSTGALNFKEVPNELIVIGGGYVGSELAGAYANLGSKVTIIEGAKSILSSFDNDMVKLVERSFKKKGIKIHDGATAKNSLVEGDRVKVTFEDKKGKEQTIEADYCLVTVGRRPNTDEFGFDYVGIELDERGLVKVDKQGRTNKEHIYAIGDIVPGAALAHKASYEGKIAAAAISGDESAIVDYIGMPAVAFTDPELATVGHTEASAKEAGIEARAAKFSLGGNGRALSLNQTDGFVRLVVREEDDVIIGAQVAGPNASDVIAELGLAVEAQMTVEDVALTIHAHPTLAEATMDAAEMALGMPIHN